MQNVGVIARPHCVRSDVIIDHNVGSRDVRDVSQVAFFIKLSPAFDPEVRSKCTAEWCLLVEAIHWRIGCSGSISCTRWVWTRVKPLICSAADTDDLRINRCGVAFSAVDHLHLRWRSIHQ